MIVISCINASPRIRGELTRFLYEIGPGIYVGDVSAEVRERLYEKIERLSCSLLDFKLVMIYSYKNENGFKYRYINYSNYQMMDFDNLALPVFVNLLEKK